MSGSKQHDASQVEPINGVEPLGFRNFVLTGRFLPYLFFSIAALAVVAVIGSIVVKAVKNHGLMPLPDTPDTYLCEGLGTAFSVTYLHGSDRVQLQAPSGVLKGGVYNNRFDWINFTGDATQLGFLPPTEITYEDSKSLRISGPGYTDLVCTMGLAHTSHRRAIVQ